MTNRGRPAPLSPEVVAAHQAAVDTGAETYVDPSTGLLVFTASYHLARGSCCDSGCRHCPYGT